uniref:Candidate secreted effector n=1 Tax=Meloidogyne incognita TaxID=6306 RepID=A0A914L9E7_MELIC
MCSMRAEMQYTRPCSCPCSGGSCSSTSGWNSSKTALNDSSEKLKIKKIKYIKLIR